MNSFAEFMRMFLSYGVLFVISVCVMIVGAIVGITMRKRKNAKNEAAQPAENEAS